MPLTISDKALAEILYRIFNDYYRKLRGRPGPGHIALEICAEIAKNFSIDEKVRLINGFPSYSNLPSRTREQLLHHDEQELYHSGKNALHCNFCENLLNSCYFDDHVIAGKKVFETRNRFCIPCGLNPKKTGGTGYTPGDLIRLQNEKYCWCIACDKVKLFSGRDAQVQVNRKGKTVTMTRSICASCDHASQIAPLKNERDTLGKGGKMGAEVKWLTKTPEKAPLKNRHLRLGHSNSVNTYGGHYRWDTSAGEAMSQPSKGEVAQVDREDEYRRVRAQQIREKHEERRRRRRHGGSTTEDGSSSSSDEGQS
jgi:hypothetical protein